MIATRQPQTGQPVAGDTSSERPVLQFIMFAALALLATYLFATELGGVSLQARDLVDTDGYMRFLRVEALLNGGEWFDPVFTRSNHPFGETSHWTRLLDVYVAGLALLLSPILGSSEALYWAAVWNGPLVFLGVGATAYWAVRPYVPAAIRAVVMPAILALPVVFLYTGLGRVDHHGPILIALMMTLGWVLRLVSTRSNQAVVWLGVSMGLGLWLSVEFLVAVALVALTLGVYAVREEPGVARQGAVAFSLTALISAAAVLIERGPRWNAVEVDRLSVAHIALLLATAGALATFWLVGRRLGAEWAKWAAMTGCTVTGIGLAVLFFPELLAGPFGMVHPRVREIWLYEVAELRPITDYTDAGWPMMVMAPSILGLAAGIAQVARRQKFAVLLTGWLVAYAVLSVFQVRWALFAHMLALPLLLTALAPVYDWLGGRRVAVILRPLFLVAVILAVPTMVIFVDSRSAQATTKDCQVSSVTPTLETLAPTVVLASQDLGPEILYRTEHDVIATPYHRNEAGILYVRDVMSMPPDEAREALAARGVGLILLCAGKEDLTRPVDIEGTLYESLVTGPHPDYVTRIPVGDETDLILFEVSPT
jgi:hypothetical protein